MHRETDAQLAPWRVTADQFVVLGALSEGDALSQRELVERTSSDPSTLRAMLVLLEGRDLIARRPHPTDGRARSVRLTARGRRTFTRMWSHSELLRESLVAGLTPAEARQLVRLLGRVRRGLDWFQARSQPARERAERVEEGA
jgi:DNA-binding MarR family transcriptional regulator